MSCQRSARFNNATMAPVSTRASAPMTLPDALPDDLTRVLCIVGTALNRSNGFRGGRMKTPLLNGIVLCAALLKPLVGGEIQRSRKRDLPAARFALQARFQLRGDPPAIHFGLHALHCSATRTEPQPEHQG